MIGKTVSHYKIIEKIGAGGMGVVYLGVREGDQFKRRVAIKVLKRGTDTDSVLHRFELERQVLSALNHPGIARLYDAGKTEDGVPYFLEVNPNPEIAQQEEMAEAAKKAGYSYDSLIQKGVAWGLRRGTRRPRRG